MRANEFFYSCIIPFFNSVLEFYLVIVTIKIITAQNMTVKQETLIYQPYYDLAKNSITMLSVIRGVRLRFKFFWIFEWNIRRLRNGPIFEKSCFRQRASGTSIALKRKNLRTGKYGGKKEYVLWLQTGESLQHYQLSDASERGESDAGVFKFWCSTSSCNSIVHNVFKENISNYLRII